MIYFLFASSACNLSCTYCGGTPEDLCMPVKPTYALPELLEFLKQDPSPIVVFYGGEPLTNLPYVERVIDALPQATFVLQSNVTLLHALPTKYLLRFSCILVSVDGRPETVEAYRGPGIYDRIFKNIEDARERGFHGSFVARMACSLRTDVYEDVTHLARHPFHFDAIYWQLDCQWDSPMNIRWGECPQGGFEEWMRQSYMPGMEKLHREWVEQWTGNPAERWACRVIVPFNTISEAFFPGFDSAPAEVRERISRQSVVHDPDNPTAIIRKGYLRCSAGHNAISITTDGRVLACPVASDEAWNNLGKISGDAREMVTHLRVGKQCDSCEVKPFCGGRCLYANHTQWWGEEGFALVCELNRQLVRLCSESKDAVFSHLERNPGDWDEFCYPAEYYSLEIMP